MKRLVVSIILFGWAAGGCIMGGGTYRTVAVMDETGKAVAGAKILAVGKDYRETARTDASGAARLRRVEGPISVVVQGEWHDPAQIQSTTNRLVKVVLFRSRP